VLNVQDPTELTRKGFVTNYPSFRQWRREGALEGLSLKPLNIYIHLPYCIQRCNYCHYKTTTLRKIQLAAIDRYVDSLCQEIALAVKRFGLAGRPVISLYFGGGTPSLLSERNLSKLMTSLRGHLTLSEPEITVEAEPVTLTRKKAQLLSAFGVNRLSLGVQSFSEEVVARTGRKDTERQARGAIDIALATGAVVNLDLISGLAGETRDTWAYSVHRAIETGVHSITTYKLEVYANTAYYDDLRHQRIELPSDREECEFARFAFDALRGAGYMPVNFFTFTKGGGYIQRHTTTKWQGVDVYAFGSSAFGFLGNWAFQNTIDLNRYSELIEANELPIFRGYSYNGLEMMTRDVILGLKLIRFDRAAFKARHGLDLLRLCAATVRQLEDDGFVCVDENAIVLTERGILYGDYVGRVLACSLETLAT
jgi:oxygen-independent coproporphyrinogen-3 oxidase